MKKLTYKGRTVKVKATTYRNNGTLAVMLIYDNGDSDVITTNLNSLMQSDSMAFLWRCFFMVSNIWLGLTGLMR